MNVPISTASQLPTANSLVPWRKEHILAISTERMHQKRDEVATAAVHASATLLRGSQDAQTVASSLAELRATPPLRNTPELALAQARELEQESFWIWRDGAWCEPTRIDLI